MPSLRVRAEAEADLADAYAGYEERQPGLGRALLDAIDHVFTRVSQMPRQFPVVHLDVRRALSKRFPFAVFFVLQDEVAIVISVVPQAVHPGRWKRRR